MQYSCHIRLGQNDCKKKNKFKIVGKIPSVSQVFRETLSKHSPLYKWFIYLFTLCASSLIINSLNKPIASPMACPYINPLIWSSSTEWSVGVVVDVWKKEKAKACNHTRLFPKKHQVISLSQFKKFTEI